MGVPIRPAVTGLPRYKAGRPATPGPDGRAYKLSSNENPYPPLPTVLEAVRRSCERMNLYPDPGNTAMAEAVADQLAVTPDRLAFGTGSVAVLYHLLQATCAPGDEVVYAWRSFEAYPIAVQLTGATAVPVPLGPGAVHDLDAMAAAITERTRAVLVCTPNNPTGPVVAHDELAAFLDRVPPSVMVVVDEAYVEFVDDPRAARGLDLITGRDNVVVLRTFSKAYGLAGFRVGYCVAEPDLAAAVRAAALPFGVSVPAQAAVLASLQVPDALAERVVALIGARRELTAGLRGSDLPVVDGQANFVWLAAGERTGAWGEHFAAGGVMTRPYLAGDAHDGIRITVGDDDANARVLELAATLPR